MIRIPVGQCLVVTTDEDKPLVVLKFQVDEKSNEFSVFVHSPSLEGDRVVGYFKPLAFMKGFNSLTWKLEVR